MERALEARRLHEGGMSVREIAKKLGIKKTRAHQLIVAGRTIHAKRMARGVL